jgi:spore coat polysaccharide biosynthesis predicted glycosyltransferase SpsG
VVGLPGKMILKKLLILTEGGQINGYGHITRCISLAKAFSQAGYNTLFFVDGDCGTLEFIKASGFNAELSEWFYSDNLKKIVSSSDLVIVDSFIVSEYFALKIAEWNDKTIYIDDWIRRPYTTGAVIDWTINAEEYFYKQRFTGVKWLLGSSFVSLRPPFWNIAKSNKVLPESAENVLITFGGSDIRNMTPIILSLLASNFPYLRKTVIIGNGFSNTEEIKAISDDKTELHYNCDAAMMASLMTMADFAICGGGQTVYEMACCALPPVLISIVDDQIDDISGFSEKGFSFYAGEWNSPDLTINIINATRKLIPREERSRRGTIGQNLVDGSGAQRIVNEIEKWIGKKG